MAGGTWQSQNKVLPGAYINFKSVPRPMVTVGDRGIGTMPLQLDWGAEGELIDVYSTDMLDGKSLAKVGVTAFDSAAKLLNLMLGNCYMAKIFRLNSGGTRAAADIGGLTARAKYSGTFGNKITVSVVADESLFIVTTFIDGTSKDTQRVMLIEELDDNDFVTFSGEGTFTENAGIPLIGGTNGVEYPPSAYPTYLALASMARWQCMAIPANGITVNPQINTFIKRMRDDEGRYVTAALADYAGADYEGIINSIHGTVIDGETITKDEFTAWVAGATAGAAMTQSNAGRVVRGATQIIGELDVPGQIEALRRGKFILGTNQNGDIAVVNDINSLHTFTPEKNKSWSLNQFIRVIDNWGVDVKNLWEQTYKGKVQNNINGRAIFRSDLIALANEYQRLTAIDEFAGAEDIEVSPGTELNAVLSTSRIKPVVAMTHLYMTVELLG